MMKSSFRRSLEEQVSLRPCTKLDLWTREHHRSLRNSFSTPDGGSGIAQGGRNDQLFCTRGGKKWLAVWTYGRNPHGWNDFFCLYNLGTMKQTAKLPSKTTGSFTFASFSDTSSILCFLEDYNHKLHIFDLDERTGNLTLSRSFKVYSPHNNSAEVRILAITRSQEVLVEVSFGAAGHILRLFPLVPRSFREGYYDEMIAIASRELNLIKASGEQLNH